jgi:TolA-binding protein
MRAASALLLLLVGLTACSGKPAKPEAGTLGTLSAKKKSVERETPIEGSRSKALQAYRSYLDIAPKHALRPEAMRRLGDMEVEGAELHDDASGKKTRDDYRRAIATYEKLLRAHPNYPGNDRVLYQLARAHENVGELKQSLAVLDRLVSAYPRSPYQEEAQFRRGEMLFTLRDYEGAQRAYASIVRRGEISSYYERSLYMHGWSSFKIAQYEDGLQSFFLVLDRKLIGRDKGGSLEDIKGLTRADRELVEDTFRVMSISFTALDGPASIPPFFKDARRRDYEFRVYQQLGDLYFKQQRVKDAADTYNAFARRYPTHPQAPLVQVRVIEAYQQAGFASLALETKKEFVLRYGVVSDFRRANSPEAYTPVEAHVRKHMEELARHHHATAQKSKSTGDYREAERWYQLFLDSFPRDKQTTVLSYQYADLFFEQKNFASAATQYEHTAYNYPRHAKSADAGYAALQSYAKQAQGLKDENQKRVIWRSIASSLRFAERFPQDARVAGVLTNTAEQYTAQGEPKLAVATSRRVLAILPPVSRDLQRTNWTVVAHGEFDQKNYARAEEGYMQVLALTDVKAANRNALLERLAASVYKQGEAAKAAGKEREAVGHFQRVALLAPASAIRVNADYDAATGLIALKDWTAAATALENFRRAYPKHPLQQEMPGKLALVYLEGGQPAKAAVEFEQLAASGKDVRVGREALWQAAELYEKAGQEKSAVAVYERYIKQHPRPLESSIEARQRLINLARTGGQSARVMTLSRELVEAEKAGGRERTDRTRAFGAQATLVIAEPIAESYREVKLVEPLKKNLKLKKERMQKALDAYGVAAEYGVAEVATAAVYRTADLYTDFSQALLKSQRPKGLNAEETEQYNIMLEEQVFPFEEKAIEIHEINAKRTSQGIYDNWVKQSFAALAKLRPARYAKSEKSGGYVNAIR